MSKRGLTKGDIARLSPAAQLQILKQISLEPEVISLQIAEEVIDTPRIAAPRHDLRHSVFAVGIFFALIIVWRIAIG